MTDVEAPPRTRLVRRVVAATVAVALAVALVLGYLLWWSRPTTFGVVGNAWTGQQSVATMHPVTVDMVQRSNDDGAETVTLEKVTPRVVTNTADARITLAVCRRVEDVIVDDGPAEASCTTVTPVTGQRVRLDPDTATTTITMTVTPRRAGEVVIRGMDVTYARGPAHLWQRGTEATGLEVTIRVRS